MFNSDKIHDNILTPGNVLNIVIYGSPFWVIIYTSYTLSFSTNGRVFLAHSVVLLVEDFISLHLSIN